MNFNSPGQVVIAGEKDAVAHACELMKEAGAKRGIGSPGKRSITLLTYERGRNGI